MALDRNVGLKGFRYRGGLNMLSWRLHRWSGIGIVCVRQPAYAGIPVTQVFGSSAMGRSRSTRIYMSVYFQILVVVHRVFPCPARAARDPPGFLAAASWNTSVKSPGRSG